ncbi:lipopolysaccharide biosynthesis protein [Aquabacterium sp. OR-4]|uniref:lipopolysaccharide biosynthesis protein n=1 Tax=Aquabacterium sp. OR-4 TaxID=2978127 RepID=UPI0021B192B3|nr:oligosaccharide flippase family protein [Aquabacterium sp. OR-4]MDT7834473.1 oligosaccharide flippase family protein [Aquabacterium sp. OR-4]
MSRTGLRRAVFTLLAGGALAQALPLLLGPWLTRLYTPENYGQYHLFAAVAANIAVVACGRYEFALPMAADEAEARALRHLCQRVLGLVVVITLAVAVAWAVALGAVWPLWLPASVGALGQLSLATLLATRAQQFKPLATARVLQHGGGALGQVGAGLVHGGVQGLIVGALVAVMAAWAALGGLAARSARLPAPIGNAPEGPLPPDWRAAARRYRHYPLLNTPHAFLGALQDTVAVALIAAQLGAAAAGVWGLALRYLKAPATLVGSAVSQALHPRLAQAGCTPAGRALVLRTMLLLAAVAVPLVLLLWAVAPPLFVWAFGPAWADAGTLGRALALYIGLHFVASPLGVVTLAWDAQAWALKLALVGQGLFVAALATGLHWDGLRGAGWAVSLAMAVYFGWYFLKLATWPVAVQEG